MTEREILYRHIQDVNEALRASVFNYAAYDARYTEEKDEKRLTKIYGESKDKWVLRCQTMANRIEKTDKAVRRARACVEMAPKSADWEKVGEMCRTFLKRAVVLHVGELDPRDIVKLRLAGAIK